MATLDTASETASPPRAPVVRRSALGCTKVRDSCQSCATSKIKCPKEKPSCSKCQARGIECQYIFARRPGRRRENSTGHPTSCTSNTTTTTTAATTTTNSSSSSSSSNSSSSSSSSTSPPSSSPSSSSLASNPKPTSDKDPPRPRPGDAEPSTLPPVNNNSVLNIAPTDNVLGPYSPDLFSVLEDPSVFAPLPDFDSNMTDVDFSTMDYFEQPVMDGDNFTRALSDIGSLLIPETISFDLGALESDPLSASAVPSLASSVPTPSTAHSVTMMRGPPASSISCRCVAQALDLLKALSAKSAPVSPFSGPGAASMTTMSSAQALMGENQQYIDTVSNLLSCSSCTEDTFLLAIVSMIVLKILERYASAARAQVGGGESDTGQRPSTSMIPNGRTR